MNWKGLGVIILFLGVIAVFTQMSFFKISSQNKEIIANQKLQMKQQFHSDFIALISLFGEDGLNKLYSAKTSKELTKKEGIATGLMLQRFIVANRIRDAWTAEEWLSIEDDIKAALKGSELLRSRWEQVRQWYANSDREFLDKIFFNVMDELINEKEKTKLPQP